ncbi:MarR family transcriptional regulator [Streptomyces sp. NPDC058576]|uniref:MarR family transcriptional regulator n=1 Tax=Streptomyces sp. NPDC058576 TaxID=3346547 RepID=UPI00364C6C28
MATQHLSSALPAPAVSAAHPMAKPGYGKRSAPDQQVRTRYDFALLPTRERYVAGFVDHLPEGSAMSVKTLAKQLPLYGQQAISTALTALSVAGHLRRVRCAVDAGHETRWVFRTFWSRTARDNEWWNTYLATENAAPATSRAPDTPAPHTAAPSPWVPAEGPPPPEPSAPTSVPDQRVPAEPQETAPSPDPDQGTVLATAPTAPRSPAYLALARLGRKDHRLALSADDCVALEAQAAEWFNRGVDAEYLITALTAGLPDRVDVPVRFVRRRLADKIPPRLSADRTPPVAPAHRVLMECTECGVPGRPEALPDGLCRPCRADHQSGPGATPIRPTGAPADAPDVGAYIAGLRDMLKAP